MICGRRKIDGRRLEGCGPGMPGPYGGWKGKRVLTGRCAGGMNPSPTGCREQEIVGRPALRPPRACMGAGMISGYPLYIRRLQIGAAEGSRPLPTMRKIRECLWKVRGPGMPGPYGVVEG